MTLHSEKGVISIYNVDPWFKTRLQVNVPSLDKIFIQIKMNGIHFENSDSPHPHHRGE